MAAERLALLCNLAGTFCRVRKPAWTQDRVIDIGLLDQRR
jgi:hypothetical protein